MGDERHVRVFRNGRNRAVRIPKEFDIFGDVVSMRLDGDRLVIDAVQPEQTLAELFDSFETLDEEWPELDDPPPAPIKL